MSIGTIVNTAGVLYFINIQLKELDVWSGLVLNIGPGNSEALIQ